MPWDGTSGQSPASCKATVSTTAIDQVATKIAIVEKGADGSDSSGAAKQSSYTDFVTGEWAWTPSVSGLDLNSGFSNDSIAKANGDCDYTGKQDANWNQYGNCASLPRYRHNGTANASYFDGHAKASSKNQINWLRNVYIPNISGTPW